MLRAFWEHVFELILARSWTVQSIFCHTHVSARISNGWNWVTFQRNTICCLINVIFQQLASFLRGVFRSWYQSSSSSWASCELRSDIKFHFLEIVKLFTGFSRFEPLKKVGSFSFDLSSHRSVNAWCSTPLPDSFHVAIDVWSDIDSSHRRISHVSSFLLLIGWDIFAGSDGRASSPTGYVL